MFPFLLEASRRFLTARRVCRACGHAMSVDARRSHGNVRCTKCGHVDHPPPSFRTGRR